MPFSLEDFDAALEHGSLYAWLASVRLSEFDRVAELEFNLRYGWVETGTDAPEVVGRVGLRFRGVADWSLNAQWIGGVQVVDSHPAMAPLVDATSQLSYKGEPADPEATLAALYLTHARNFGSSVAMFLQPASSFRNGWTTGTVAKGPTSLMQAYARVLEQHGLQASLLPAGDAPSAEARSALTAWTVGEGYVIASSLETYGELPPVALDTVD